MTHGERIRAARLERGWSLQLLAERARLAISTIHLIEKNKSKHPRFESIERLYRQLDIPLEQARI